jgi:hypothetical protein
MALSLIARCRKSRRICTDAITALERSAQIVRWAELAAAKVREMCAPAGALRADQTKMIEAE